MSDIINTKDFEVCILLSLFLRLIAQGNTALHSFLLSDSALLDNCRPTEFTTDVTALTRSSIAELPESYLNAIAASMKIDISTCATRFEITDCILGNRSAYGNPEEVLSQFDIFV